MAVKSIFKVYGLHYNENEPMEATGLWVSGVPTREESHIRGLVSISALVECVLISVVECKFILLKAVFKFINL